MAREVGLKTLFVGLDNPQSADPRYALYPAPSGCAGFRLHAMMDEAMRGEFTRHEYVNIPKTNLFPVGMAPKKNRRAMMCGAARLLMEQLRDKGTIVVLLGREVSGAITEAHQSDVEMEETKFYEMWGSVYTWVPHPSGRNHYYNNKRNRLKIGKFLANIVRGVEA